MRMATEPDRELGLEVVAKARSDRAGRGRSGWGATGLTKKGQDGMFQSMARIAFWWPRRSR